MLLFRRAAAFVVFCCLLAGRFVILSWVARCVVCVVLLSCRVANVSHCCFGWFVVLSVCGFAGLLFVV